MEKKKIKVMTVFGTRPEAIKMAPIVLELQKHPEEIEPVVAVTAQHRDMLDQVLNLFKIKPDHDLDIMSAGQTLFDITSKAMMGLDKVLQQEKPDIVLVHGDTTTTFAGALTASSRAALPPWTLRLRRLPSGISWQRMCLPSRFSSRAIRSLMPCTIRCGRISSSGTSC